MIDVDLPTSSRMLNSPAHRGRTPSNAARRRRDVRNRALAYAALMLFSSGLLVLSFLLSVPALESGQVSWIPTCWSVRFFQRPCPSCGMTRAFVALSHGQWRRAWDFNAASVPAYGLCWLLVLYGGSGVIQNVRQYRRIPSSL